MELLELCSKCDSVCTCSCRAIVPCDVNVCRQVELLKLCQKQYYGWDGLYAHRRDFQRAHHLLCKVGVTPNLVTKNVSTQRQGPAGER